MLRKITLAAIALQLLSQGLVSSEKQQIQLSESYLPVAMQVIAHLTDQMAYEVRDEPTPAPTKPPARPGSKPTAGQPIYNRPTTPKPTMSKPTASRPTTSSPMSSRPATMAPYVTWSHHQGSFQPISSSGWWMSYGTERLDMTTAYHKPGLYQPFSPPKPNERSDAKAQHFVLLPMESNKEYTVIKPEDKKTSETLLSIHQEEVKPLVDPSPEEAPLLPPHFDADEIQSRSDMFDIDDDDSLQYLSQNVREMIKLANDPSDDKLVDIWEEVRAGPQQMAQKVKLSTSNLRLLLLYDLLSREAKRQKLSDYTGFAPDVMRTLVDSSGGGARAQLRLALSKMLERHDCEHEYANNRAREMVTELAKDESKLSSELRYLQPLVYMF